MLAHKKQLDPRCFPLASEERVKSWTSCIISLQIEFVSFWNPPPPNKNKCELCFRWSTFVSLCGLSSGTNDPPCLSCTSEEFSSVRLPPSPPWRWSWGPSGSGCWRSGSRDTRRSVRSPTPRTDKPADRQRGKSFCFFIFRIKYKHQDKEEFVFFL